MTNSSPTGVRRAAVLGSPIDHSRSPDLHLAAYRALGLTGWTYRRMECSAHTLPSLVDGLDASYVGLSVTMPAKVAALHHAATVTDRARLVGSANTLVRNDTGGWHADCTDIDGVAGALVELDVARLDGSPVVLIGAGGTARPALAALATAGAGSVSVVVRDVARAAELLELAHALGMAAETIGFDRPADVTRVCARAAVVVSTVPAEAAAGIASSIGATMRLVDAIYHPWPTAAASAVIASGGRVVGGLVMLLNQACTQVELFTGLPAPRHAMAAALRG